MTAACEACGWVHGTSDVYVVGRFDPTPLGFRAVLPGAEIRATRALAMQDMCESRRGGAS